MDSKATGAVMDLAAHSNDAAAPQMLLNRRGVLGVGVAGVLGLAFTQIAEQKAQAAPAGSDVAEGTCLLLPAEIGAGMIGKFMQDPGFATLHKYFSGQGFEFIPSRAKVSVYLAAPSATGVAPAPPCLHIIMPSFRQFDATAPSHEAVSIVAVCVGDAVGGASAAKVVVGHRPYNLRSMSFFDVYPDGSIGERGASRRQLQRLSVDELVKLVGPPPPDPVDGRPAPNMSSDVMQDLAALAYRRLIHDAYARPLYPTSGLATMLADTDLVQKWTEVQRTRYAAGGSIGWCSSSTSSNACTSTSSSIIIDIRL